MKIIINLPDTNRKQADELLATILEMLEAYGIKAPGSGVMEGDDLLEQVRKLLNYGNVNAFLAKGWVKIVRDMMDDRALIPKWIESVSKAMALLEASDGET